MYQKRKQKRNEKRKKRIEKRNQEEEEEEREEEQEEQEEEIRRGLSNKRYVCSCNIENTCLSLFTDYSFTVYRWMEVGGWRMEDGGWRMEKTTTENENLNMILHVEKDEYETECTATIEPI